MTTKREALEALRGPLYGQPWLPSGEVTAWVETPGGSDLVGELAGRLYARILGSACGDWTVYFSGFEFSLEGSLDRAQHLVQAILEGETFTLR